MKAVKTQGPSTSLRSGRDDGVIPPRFQFHEHLPMRLRFLGPSDRVFEGVDRKDIPG
jgi:hypothetical protein